MKKSLLWAFALLFSFSAEADPQYQNVITIPTRNVANIQVISLSAGVSQQLVAKNMSRKFLKWQVLGPGAVTFTTTCPAVAGQGFVYDPGVSTTSQGGGFESVSFVPTNEYCVISASASTVILQEGE